MEVHKECFPEMIEFLRDHASDQECAFLDRYCEILKRDHNKIEPGSKDSLRFTEIANQSGYFESEVFFRHLQKMQPIISNLLDQLEEGE